MKLFRTLRVLYHRWRIRKDLTTHAPDEHPGLRPFRDGELLHMKGVEFRIRARYTDPAPCLILEPMGSTKNAKLNRLRDLRREDRIERGQAEQLAKRLERRWREARYVD
jgi:hypothetical protein